MDALREILSRLGRPEALEPLLAYVTLLERLGRGTNLIGPLSRDRILSELIADALLPAMARPPLGPLLDIGSGAGLPGLPLAITFPELPVHLVEPRQKRVTFLKTVTRRLGLTQVQIHGQRIEAFTACAPHTLGTIAAKAFRPPADFIQEATQWRRQDGLVYLYLSQASWDERAEAAARDAGLTVVGRAAHPTHEDRHAVVIGSD